MHITGECRIPATRARVWRSLADVSLIRESITGIRIDRHGAEPGGLVLSGVGTPTMMARQILARQIFARQSVREPFATLGWKIDPDGPDSQSALVRLAEDGAFTRLSYEVSLADPENGNSAEASETVLRGSIEQALRRLANQFAGSAETAAGGIEDAIRAARSPSAQTGASVGGVPADGQTALTRVLDPSVIGGVLFLGVLLLVFGLI